MLNEYLKKITIIPLLLAWNKISTFYELEILDIIHIDHMSDGSTIEYNFNEILLGSIKRNSTLELE